MQLLAVAVAIVLQVVGGSGAAADRGAVLQAQHREAAAQLPPVHIFYYSWFGAPSFFDGSGSSFRGGEQQCAHAWTMCMQGQQGLPTPQPTLS